LIYAKFGADLMNISKVTIRETKWPRWAVFMRRLVSTRPPILRIFCRMKFAVDWLGRERTAAYRDDLRRLSNYHARTTHDN